MRLEVTLSGEFYKICAQHVTKGQAERLRQAYDKQWRQILGRVAVGPGHKEALSDVAAKTGQVPQVEYQRSGVLLSSPTLSLHILVNGKETVAEALDQELHPVAPARIMEKYAVDDVLGVSALTGGGYLHCVFPSITDFDGSRLKLVCDDLQKLMNRKDGFELVHTMTYDSLAPEKVECVPASSLEHAKQVYHAKRD